MARLNALTDVPNTSALISDTIDAENRFMSGINGIGAQQTPSSGAAYDAKRVQREAGGGNAGALREKGTGGDSVNFSSEAKQAGKGVFSESAGSNLSPEEQAQVQELKKLDQQVRQHEAAHMAAAGGYARGGANYSYTTGPDGRRYATGGEVSIDVSAERTPEATIQKMQVVKQAALAPANPSPQGRAV